MRQFSFRTPKELDERLKNLDAHHGGEGSVYNDHQDLAIKIFNAKEVNIARKERKVYQLVVQSKKIRYNEVIIPIEPVTVRGHFVGYTMKYVKNAVDLNCIVDKTFMGERNVQENLIITIRLAQVVRKIHKMGMIIGDFHPGQVLVSNDDIYFVDTDSWGWIGRSKELKPDGKGIPFYIDPKSRDFSSMDIVIKHYSQESDYYSLAVIAFYVLTGEHPFGGIYQIDTNMSNEMRARNMLSVLGNHDIKIMKGRTWEIWMTDELKKAFLDIFENGKRYNIEVALLNQFKELKYCEHHKGYYNRAYEKCPICNVGYQNNKIASDTAHNFMNNLFLSNLEIKKLYDYRTYLNKIGEVVRVNDRGEEIRKSAKGVGKTETYFLEDDKYVIKIKPLNIFQKITNVDDVEKACYVYIYIYKNGIKVEKFYISNRNTIKIYGNSLYYVEENIHTHTLKKITVLEEDVKNEVVATKQVEFEYIATSNSKYAIISKNQNGSMEIDIDGVCTSILEQKPIIMKYDEISNMWILVSKVSKKYNTIVFKEGTQLIETTDINYDTMNLQGSVFHKGTLCLASEGKIIFVMPYVENMPISKVITETMISIVSKKSQLEVKQISENRSEIYVLNEDRNVYKFVM